MSTKAQRTRNTRIVTNIIMLVSGIIIGTYYAGYVPSILEAGSHLIWQIVAWSVGIYCAHAFVSGIIVGIREAMRERHNV